MRRRFPFTRTFSYDSWGRRIQQTSPAGTTTATYDGAGRLVQVVDAATNTTEHYVWNADGTLSSFPGSGYVRRLEYDEEGRLVRIRRDYGGGNVQVAYEYGYGFDGGRRWRKDYVNGVWTRYPCGVACGAGDLVEQRKPLEGGQWVTSALYLQGISLVRRNSEWHHFDPFGTAGVITNHSASVISRNLYDLFGVLRDEQGSAQTPWRWDALHNDAESLLSGNSGLFIMPRVAGALRWSWRWPPFRIGTPRMPPGGRAVFCYTSCGIAAYSFLGNWLRCSDAGGFLARFRCAFCRTVREFGGFLGISGCAACLCMVFGGGWWGAVGCGVVGGAVSALMCLTYQEPPPVEYHYHYHYHFHYYFPYPVPMLPESSSPGFF